jgi:hypothetical protein
MCRVLGMVFFMSIVTVSAFAEERAPIDTYVAAVAAAAAHPDLAFPSVSENQSDRIVLPAYESSALRIHGCPTFQNPCGTDMVCSLSAAECKSGFGTTCCDYLDQDGSAHCHSC